MLVERILERRALEKTFVENPAQWLIDMFGGRAAASGVKVTPITAMQCVAVFACVRILAETIASLPLIVYRRLDPRGKERAPEHALYPILHDRPNPEQTSFEWREMMQGHLELRGNAYSEIIRNGRGQVVELWPLNPDKTKAERLDDDRLVYRVELPRGSGQRVTLRPDQVLHQRGLSSDGVNGLSPIQLAKEAIGLTIAVEEYGARFFGNGAVPGGVLEHPNKLGKEAHARLKQSWEEVHGGLSNAHRVAIFEEGLKWHQLGIPNDHAQFLQTRKFQKSEINALFRVPPHKTGDLDKATFSNIEHQAIEFVVDAIRPRVIRNEQAMMLKLLTPAERKTHYIEHLIDGLLRGDQKARNDAYAVGRQWGWLSADDVRELENMNPLPAGQGAMYLVPINMQPADQVGMVDPDDPDPDEEPPADRPPLVRAWRRVFEDAFARVIRREAVAVRKAARRLLAERGLEAFEEWTAEFYRDHAVAARAALQPGVFGFGEALAGTAPAPTLQRFLIRYGEQLADGHVAAARRAIERLTRDTAAAGGDLAGAIEAAMERWEGSGPAETADREITRAAEAIGRELEGGAR